MDVVINNKKGTNTTKYWKNTI